MSACLGPVAAALVDGELDHAAREKAHRHLAHCASCRAEVDAQRRLKARLLGLDGPPPPESLTARLLRLREPDAAGLRPLDVRPPVEALVPTDALTARLLGLAGGTTPSGPVRPTARAGRSGPPRRSAGLRRVRALRRRAVTGTAFAALGVAAALALGGQPPRPASTPVDPGTDAFVAEFVSTTSDETGPTGDRVGVTRAGLTGRGAGSSR